ncbi:MAG: 2-C-methyl-D-erythritol 4-phosphate cytidylyltransferase [Chlamydiia bacterium]|nr:2-C-methyl-D-erythritol 4-phosphate cytidylyltransferase [Chlamydiia bacterium]
MSRLKIGLVLLAGGKGTRMGLSFPKQFYKLKGKEIALHSLEILVSHPRIEEIAVVTPQEYQMCFIPLLKKTCLPFFFGEPGKRRQDSLANGMQLLSTPWICVHDAVRPFISHEMLDRLFCAQHEAQAIALGMPMKATVKECREGGWVDRTLDREKLFEIQTPQLVTKEVLSEGFALANKENLTVTDDVSLAELANIPVKIITGSYQNIKITTQDDLEIQN